jgi:hypothetical protein
MGMCGVVHGGARCPGVQARRPGACGRRCAPGQRTEEEGSGAWWRAARSRAVVAAPRTAHRGGGRAIERSPGIANRVSATVAVANVRPVPPGGCMRSHAPCASGGSGRYIRPNPLLDRSPLTRVNADVAAAEEEGSRAWWRDARSLGGAVAPSVTTRRIDGVRVAPPRCRCSNPAPAPRRHAHHPNPQTQFAAAPDPERRRTMRRKERSRATRRRRSAPVPARPSGGGRSDGRSGGCAGPRSASTARRAAPAGG